MSTTINPRVTIGIPTYNRANGYFRQALESALNQTYQNLEIIIADNCSTDNTESYVNSILDSRIKYYRHTKNISPNDNFNFCLNKATGVYFLLLHDDDVIDSDFVETCMKKAGTAKMFGIVRTGTRVIDADGKVINNSNNNAEGLSVTDFILSWFRWKTAFYFCSLLYNTVQLREIGGIKSKKNLFQDVVTAVKLADKYGRVDVYDIKSSFRKHGGEMTLARKIDDWVEDSLYLLDLICDIVPEKKEQVRREGMSFFSKFNYGLARKIKSPLGRLITYAKLIRIFRLVFLNQLMTQLFYNTSIYPALKYIKRNLFSQNKN